MKEIMLEIVRSINWGDVLTSVLNTFIYLMIPIGLELVTGVLRTTSAFLEANKENSWAIRLAADVATTMSAQWQIEAKDIRAKWDAGELTPEEWEKEKEDLRKGFKEKMMVKLKAYPAAYAAKFEKDIEDHMEAWIAKNKQIESLLKTLKEKTVINDPVLLAQLKEQLESQIKNINPELSA